MNMFLSCSFGHFAARWTAAAKEGMVIYLRGTPVHMSLPPDLVERMLDYVIHVLATLALLFNYPGKHQKHAKECCA